MEPTYAQPYPQPQFVMMPVPQTNGLGVFAFFVALVGLFIPTGIVSLLGLVLSLAAIGRAPRGFATCGVILGLLGTVFWVMILLVALALGLVAAIGMAICVAAAFLLTQPEVIEVTGDMINTAIAVQEYQQDHDGQMPPEITALALAAATTIDPWGGNYVLVLTDDDQGFDVVSGGPDRTLETDDDIRLSGLDRLWEGAMENFDGKMEEFGRRMERLNGNVGPCGSSDGVVWSSHGHHIVVRPPVHHHAAPDADDSAERAEQPPAPPNAVLIETAAAAPPPPAEAAQPTTVAPPAAPAAPAAPAPPAAGPPSPAPAGPSPGAEAAEAPPAEPPAEPPAASTEGQDAPKQG